MVLVPFTSGYVQNASTHHAHPQLYPGGKAYKKKTKRYTYKHYASNYLINKRSLQSRHLVSRHRSTSSAVLPRFAFVLYAVLGTSSCVVIVTDEPRML